MDDKKELKGITGFCFKHLFALMMTAVFLIIFILFFTIFELYENENIKRHNDATLFELQTERQAYEKYKNELPQLKLEYEQNSTLLYSLNKSLKTTQSAVDDKNALLSKLTDNYNKLLADTAKLQEEKAQRKVLLEEIKKYSQETVDLKKELQQNQEQAKDINLELAKLNSKKEKTEQKIGELETLLEKNTTQNSQLEAKKELLTQEISELNNEKSKLAKLQNEIDKTASNLKKKEQLLDTLINKVESKFDELSANFNIPKEVNSSLSKSSSDLQNQINDLKAKTIELSKLTIAIKRNEENLSGHSKKIEEITNLKPELEDLVKNNSLTNDKLLASLSKINNLLATLQSKNIDATIKNINAEIESIKTTLNEVNKNQKVAIQSLENNRENTQQ